MGSSLDRFISASADLGSMISSLLIVLSLLAANSAVYSLLSYRVLRRRRKIHVSNLAEAFHALERALKASLPDLPPGFTWQEALDRAEVRSNNRRDIEAALENYEAYRFGGVPYGESDFSEVVRISNRLGGSKPGRRN